MKTLLFLPLFLCFSTLVFAGECDNTDNSFRCVSYVRNYDGDTITFNIRNVHPLLGDEISIRVNGIDTPEIRTKDDCEKEKALYVRDFVGNLLANAKRIHLENLQRGKYFRVVADVIVDGINLTDLLLEKRYGYPYDGGGKKAIDWCTY